MGKARLAPVPGRCSWTHHKCHHDEVEAGVVNIKTLHALLRAGVLFNTKLLKGWAKTDWIVVTEDTTLRGEWIIANSADQYFKVVGPDGYEGWKVYQAWVSRVVEYETTYIIDEDEDEDDEEEYV